MTIDDILRLMKDGNAVQKAKAFDQVVETLLCEIFALKRTKEIERNHHTAVRLTQLDRLEQALASCGYHTGAVATK